MHAYLMRLFAILEALYPPRLNGHHHLVSVAYGSDEDGWEPKLALTLSMSEFHTFFIEPADFDKTPEALADEITGLMVGRGKFPRQRTET
jgi:hypothetical protein